MSPLGDIKEDSGEESPTTPLKPKILAEKNAYLHGLAQIEAFEASKIRGIRNVETEDFQKFYDRQ